MKIEDKVKKLIAEKLNVDISEVVPEASLIDDLGADSLAIVELIMTMEEEFDIEVPDEDAEKLAKVQRLLIILFQKPDNKDKHCRPTPVKTDIHSRETDSMENSRPFLSEAITQDMRSKNSSKSI